MRSNISSARSVSAAWRSITKATTADARSATNALSLVAATDRPPRAVTMRVLDADGREVHSAIKGNTKI
jgi:hypothetical protein